MPESISFPVLGSFPVEVVDHLQCGPVQCNQEVVLPKL